MAIGEWGRGMGSSAEVSAGLGLFSSASALPSAWTTLRPLVMPLPAGGGTQQRQALWVFLPELVIFVRTRPPLRWQWLNVEC